MFTFLLSGPALHTNDQCFLGVLAKGEALNEGVALKDADGLNDARCPCAWGDAMGGCDSV
jgi:hypothetical protein